MTVPYSLYLTQYHREIAELVALQLRRLEGVSRSTFLAQVLAAFRPVVAAPRRLYTGDSPLTSSFGHECTLCARESRQPGAEGQRVAGRESKRSSLYTRRSSALDPFIGVIQRAPCSWKKA